MYEKKCRMTDEVRRELLDAVRMERIENASSFSVEFAARHGLNPHTVRSAISRMRRDLGFAKRRPGGKSPSTEALNPMVRLMQAVRYALERGGTKRDVWEMVHAALEEYDEWGHPLVGLPMFPAERTVEHERV